MAIAIWIDARRSDRALAALAEARRGEIGFELSDAIAFRAGRSLDRTSENPLVGEVRTVGDLVHFFSARPKTG